MSVRNKIVTKLRSSYGETIVETLVTMIVLSLAMIMLSGAVVTSARVNQKADNTETTFTTDAQTSTPGTITIQENGSSSPAGLNVTVYETEHGYFYYEP